MIMKLKGTCTEKIESISTRGRLIKEIAFHFVMNVSVSNHTASDIVFL